MEASRPEKLSDDLLVSLAEACSTLPTVPEICSCTCTATQHTSISCLVVTPSAMGNSATDHCKAAASGGRHECSTMSSTNPKRVAADYLWCTTSRTAICSLVPPCPTSSHHGAPTLPHTSRAQPRNTTPQKPFDTFFPPFIQRLC